MNKVITINLNGNAYQLEEAGYEALRDYLDRAGRQLEGNPDKDEIMADIEQAVADKCRALLSGYRNVVSAQNVQAIIAEMGPVDDGSVPAGESKPGPAAASGPRAAGAGAGTPEPAKRLYRINEGAMLGGVCNGFAAYFNIDVTPVRLGFLVLTLLTAGTGVLAYLALMFVIPAADTAAQKAAAFGEPNTAQEFIRRAREGYYEGVRSFGDKKARREWKRKFKQDLRGWRYAFHYQMNKNAHQWQQNWENYWSQHPHYHAGIGLVLPFVSLLRALVMFVWIFALISFLTTGAIFGLALPAGLPWWVTLLAFLVAYNLVIWPLRAIRHSYKYGFYGPRHPPVFLGLWDAIVWLGFLALLVWLADRYVPQAHEALQNLPPVLHRAMTAVQEWWARK